MTGRYWCELAWLGGEAPVAGVTVDVDGDRITTVDASGGGAPPGATRLAGLTLPGLANAHSHAFHRALRGRTQHGTGSFWTWRSQMYALADALDPDRYHRLARAVYGEMVLAGVTCVGEFHYLHHGPDGQPYDDPNAMGEALVAAAADAGLRITLLDTCYLHGGIGVDLDGTQRRFGDGDALSWATRASGRRTAAHVHLGAAVHSVRAVDPGAMEIVRAWAHGAGAPLHAHVSEQPAENEQCRGAYGRSPTALLDDHGLLAPSFTAVHATHLGDDDIARYGRTGSTCCFCPTTERDLADGIGPGRALVDAGATLALGSDSHAAIDLFEEARGVELHERLAANVRGNHPTHALAAMATAHGHACLGWPDAGRIEAGARADLVTVRLDGVRLAGTRAPDALDAVVFAGTAGDVDHVVVGGDVVVRQGRHVRFDVADALRDALGGPAVTTTVVDDIGLLVTNDPTLGEGPLGLVRRASVVVDGGRVVSVGPAGQRADGRIDAAGRCVIPGFVDSHTHLVFAGDRADEFAARMAGRPYAAGGIRVTTEATRAATEHELRRLAAARRAEAHAAGITTIEIKSGYGLDAANEARLVRLAAELTDEVTFLGAHVVPPEFEGRADAYVDAVRGPMLAAAAPHARWIDAFCERGAFDADQCRAVLTAGRAAGLGLRLHANQLGPGPGVRLAVELGCASADHCTYLDDADVDALAGGGTVATFLPATDFSTRQPYPDARRVLDAGATVALATNCNPGSSYTTSMAFCIALAVRDLRMTTEEALWAATAGGAAALRRTDVGRLAPGACADLVVLAAPSYTHLVYRPGVPLVALTMAAGRVLWSTRVPGAG